VRSATDENGTPEGRYEYDAFGKPYKGDLTGGMNLGYTGKPYDTTTGLYNYGYRDYQPEAARFTTADPVRDGNNWFAYVNNDPVNWVDPLGLSASDKAYEAGVEAREAITDAVNTIKGIMDNGIHIGNLNVNISDLGADPLKGKITLTAQKKDSAVSIWSSYDSSNDTGRGAPLTIGGGISFGIIDLSFESAVMDHTFEMKKGTHIFPFDFPELSDINYPD
jgi:RHS repeat-associated protein